MKEFVHLHNHSEYSLLDGMLRISEGHKPSRFLRGLVESGLKSMAITDHGNMYGALDFYDSAKAAGLKPIVGCEAYITEGKYTEKDKSRTGHITLLAKNHQGYLNLMKLNSEAWVNGFYYHPRIDKELLANPPTTSGPEQPRRIPCRVGPPCRGQSRDTGLSSLCRRACRSSLGSHRLRTSIDRWAVDSSNRWSVSSIL